MPKQREKMTEVHSCGSPPFSTCLGAVASFIISQGQKCHKKPFPLVYHQSHKEKSVKGGHRPQRLPLILFFVGYNAGGENGCPSVPLLPHGFDCPFQNEKVKGCLRQFFSMLHSLIGKPKLILQIKNKPLTVSLLHFQSRPRGSKLHYILGRIYARIYPLDIGCLSCYNMCSGYIASSLKCYHFRTCEGGKPPFNPPFKRAGRLII